MKTKKNYPKHPVIDNLLKIMKDRGIKQETIAEYAEIDPSQMSKILSGKVQISVWQLSNIATKLGMRETDLFTYPDVYEKTKKGKKMNRIVVEVEVEVTDEELDKIDIKNKIINKLSI